MADLSQDIRLLLHLVIQERGKNTPEFLRKNYSVSEETVGEEEERGRVTPEVERRRNGGKEKQPSSESVGRKRRSSKDRNRERSSERSSRRSTGDLRGSFRGEKGDLRENSEKRSMECKLQKLVEEEEGIAGGEYGGEEEATQSASRKSSPATMEGVFGISVEVCEEHDFNR